MHSIDLGFINNNHTSNDIIQIISEQQQNTIAIGHSLGFLYLLKQFPHKFHHYVAINSFLRFSKNDDYPAGVPSRILQRMSKGIDKDAHLVLSQFYQQCQSSDSIPTQINLARLKTGLQYLEIEDFRNALPLLSDKLTVIASDSDPVVSAAMTKDSFKEHPIHWVQDTTHTLPITQPDLCAKTIKNIALTS
ncbi:hypothetical protein CIN_08300 [Commensalibacter intestini A911]|uniref:AB hydrolase-1 domain-containing protein n=2 Tax=Commensalibacter intestini TaxID=479936 RepID=G6EZG0_9PROT|nr:hypothetical protein CIN_08300 [Commensalibacter intestini A911]